MSLVLLVTWMIIIFLFSNQLADDSTILTNGIIKNIINILNPRNADFISNYIFLPIRKSAHFIEYLILGILCINFVKNYKIPKRRLLVLCFLICSIYACSDEFHQLFVSGRSSNIKDVCIDSVGAIIGIFIYTKIVKIKEV